MPQAIECLTVEPIASAMGNSTSVSRRAALGLGIAAPLAAALPTVAIASGGAEEDRFWQAFARWRELCSYLPPAGFDPEDDPVIMARYDAVDDALVELLLIPVHTGRAVLAKYVACDGENHFLPAPFEGSWQVIGWDLERVAKREMFA